MARSKRQKEIHAQEIKSGWKKCTKCKEYKTLDNYRKQSQGKNLEGSCKQCATDRSKEYRLKHPELRDKINAYKLEKSKTEAYRETQKKYRDNNKESIAIRNKKWNENNPEKQLKSSRKWRSKKENREKEYAQKKARLKSDPFFNTTVRIRSRIRQAFNKTRWNKNNRTKDILGCNFETAFNHLESQFTEGMSWENRSEWHIDHIKPLALANTEQELIELCHYTNLQPLWAEDNLRKGSKWEE